jgi:hypothetical protein
VFKVSQVFAKHHHISSPHKPYREGSYRKLALQTSASQPVNKENKPSLSLTEEMETLKAVYPGRGGKIRIYFQWEFSLRLGFQCRA